MKIEYGNNKLKKQLSNATEMKKAFGEMATKVSRRLDEIKASPNLAVLMKIPPARCHPLTGNRRGEWSVTISGNHRMIFEISQNPEPVKPDGSIDTVCITDITITKTEDYH